MCGIFGVASTQPFDVDLKKCTDTLAHRGPDDDGYYQDDRVALGHRRLSIIDLSGGRQPIFNESETKCIIFNGEIYNYLLLRDELMRKGHRFRTRSDTETILHAYEEWGERCVERFRGMFAFAIWDAEEKSLFIARDRVGIKPLFYALIDGTLYFGSEMKAILATNEVSRDIDEFAVACYFQLSYIPSSLTIFKQIRKLLPGHSMTWKNGDIHIRQYWDLVFEPDHRKPEETFIDEFLELMQDAVQMRLMSEVPLGVFLSGGIDSSLVAAMMSRASADAVNTFTIGFGGDTGGYLDERQYARLVAARYRANHREREVQPTPEGLLDRIVRAFDEPFADDSTIPSYFVCQAARENVTVTLSGLGGDEAFAGYERYLGFQLQSIYRRIPSLVRERLIRALVDHMPERADGHYTVNHMKRFLRSASGSPAQNYFGYMSILNPKFQNQLFADRFKFQQLQDQCFELVSAHFNSSNVRNSTTSLDRALYCDIKTYLPEDILAVTDRMSMLHALEVRVPFADHKLLELCATIPPGMKMKRFQKKHLLKKAVGPLLPRTVIHHRKQGFAAPMAQWLKSDLKSYVLDTLNEDTLKRHGLFRTTTVQAILEEHFSGRELHDTLIWALLVFQNWYDQYIE